MATAKKWLVVTGLNHPGGRAEPGDVVSDLPKKSVPWLADQGHIVPAAVEPSAEGGGE